MDSASRSFGENSRLQNVRVDPSDAQTKYLGPEPLQRHYESMYLGACRWRSILDHKSRTRGPILLMVTRCEQEANGLQP